MYHLVKGQVQNAVACRLYVQRPDAGIVASHVKIRPAVRRERDDVGGQCRFLARVVVDPPDLDVRGAIQLLRAVAEEVIADSGNLAAVVVGRLVGVAHMSRADHTQRA